MKWLEMIGLKMILKGTLGAVVVSLAITIIFLCISMEQLYLNFQLQTEPPARMEDCCFPQDCGDGSRNSKQCNFPSYQSAITQSDLTQASGQHVESEAWKPDTSLNSLCAAVDYWPEQYQKVSFSEPAEAEVEQTEDSSTASCCSMGEAPSIMLSEADSRNDLESFNASGDSWLRSAEERNSSEKSVSKKYKGRTTFSAEQLRVLQQRFQLQRYVSASERQDLGNALGLSSQQVKTWFQNRRMKVKRILKEPIAGPQIGFLQADLSQNYPLVYGKPTDYMKQQFDSYSLPHLLPRRLVSSPNEQWPSPGSVYPSLGKYQSTVIKSELQYTNQSVNFSIKKEAIALSSRPELEPMKIPVTSYSHAVPVQPFDFSLQQALSRPGHLQQALSYEMHKPADDELQYEKVIIS